MSWLNVNLNESLSNIKGQLTNLASNVLADQSEDDSGSDKERVGELQKLVSDQENEIKRLQRENNDILKRIAANNSADDWTWEAAEAEVKNEANIQTNRGGNDEAVELKVRQLELEKDELIQSLEQLDLDCQRTTDKLVAIKDELQTENVGLKLQYQDLAKANGFLKTSVDQDHKKIKILEFEKETKDVEIKQLRAELEQHKRCREEDVTRNSSEGMVNIEEYNKLQSMVSDYNQQIEVYEKELTHLRDSRCDDLSRLSGDSSQFAMHQIYFDVLLAAMKKTDNIPERWTIDARPDSGEVGRDGLHEFNNLVDNIVKTMADYKWKCDSLKVEMNNLTSEKALFLAEKNQEIEGLLQNSNEMTKALMLKNQEIAHYEQECAQINRNNEMLLNRLEESKQTNMSLHTIPEMNEHLDGQLEKCYKRIEQLEKEVGLKGNNKVEELKSEVKEWKENFNKLEEEKEQLEDMVKLENESMAEQTLSLETLQEENEILTETILDLRKENVKLGQIKEVFEVKLEEAKKEIMVLKEEMTIEIEISLKKDEQMIEFNRTVDSLELNIRKLKDQVELLSFENEELNVSQSNYVANYKSLKVDVQKLIASYKDLKQLKMDNVSIQEVIREKNVLMDRMAELEGITTEKNAIELELGASKAIISNLESDILRLTAEADLLRAQNDKFEGQISEMNASRNDIIQLVQQKHQESITYHGEIQRLQRLLSIETEKRTTFQTQLAELNGTGLTHEELQVKEKEIEKLNEQNEFLREKCALLAESLLQEQSNTQKVLADKSQTSEREVNLQRQLDSLRQHLIEIEEMYTKEVQTAEAKSVDMQQKLQTVVEKEKNSSNRYTSANIRANQQVETLQTNLQLVTNQRDELKRKVSDLEDQMEKQNAALCNLQIVLEQFQRDKEKVIYEETERVRRQILLEKKIQGTLQEQINDLKNQLDESKVGLKAAVRLTDQVESSKRQVASMKEEVAKLQALLNKSEGRYDKLLNQSDGRVDKMLVKNLVIGLVTCNNRLNQDQNQILKIISTVLDFNQKDIEKVNLNKKDQSTWFSSIVHPQSLGGQTLTSESLSQAFVKFLEAESKPRSLPNLLDATSTTDSAAKSGASSESGNSSRKNSVRQSPLLLNEVVLPTFADFAANRNSSSILKDVLKDNTNVS